MASSITPASWLRANGFLLGLVLVVAMAFLFPGPGARGGVLHPELVGNGGIALILFLQGLSLAVEKIRDGAANWRLHLVVQSFTFVIFPLVGLLFDHLAPVLWESQPAAVRQGFLYLCVLPSTVSTSVVLTAVARGNVAGALFNAALSNIVGVVITPLLVHGLMRSTGSTGSFGPLLVKIILLTLLPFALGMGLRPWLKELVERRKPWVARISNMIILFIVYTAFCDSVAENIWGKYGALLTVQTVAGVVVLFLSISLLAGGACRVLGLERDDRIAAYFCAVKKTLAMGVPLAMLIFGDSPDLSLILLPTMFYHPLQLFANGLLANRWARAKG
ncbi:sodium/bile acid cotransporter 7 [Haloferula luteola]|uniref:Sodium/bile acid cotransporter 7 n=1 Tax=Haloferula luteola TaxID=595692 RepID=A0A840V8W4_9BACT|nr:bile acid:sodium symporter family protein [Haloferula luteola]MBB5350400.1 sodium/bile acid cotransporter 7 [Haloferula luteola]